MAAKLALLVLCGSLAICSAAQPSSSADSEWKVPPEAAARKNPLRADAAVVAGGKKLFLRECAQCHGERGEGGKRKRAPDLTRPEVQLQSDGALFWKITNGNPRRSMPPWGRLPELQRWQLVLFLRTLSAEPGAPAAR